MSEHDLLDILLREALSARPEPATPRDMAARAIALAHAYEQRLIHLQRLTRWIRFTSITAGFLITLTVAAAVYLWPADLSIDSSPLTEPGYSLDGMSVGLAVLAVTVVGLALLRLVTPERPMLRFAA